MNSCRVTLTYTQYGDHGTYIYFAAAWAVGVYLFNCAVAKRFKKIDVKMASLYAAAVAMIGVFGEVTVGSVYNFLFHQTLWTYTIYPIHHGYTSHYAFFLWGIYGFHLYLFHDHLHNRNISATKHLALIFALEALIIEALVNVTYRTSFGQYIYYYYPSDLGHLTSVRTLPFYLVAGFVITWAIRRFKADPVFFAAMCLGLGVVFTFLV